MGWRTAFCTSIPKHHPHNKHIPPPPTNNSSTTPPKTPTFASFYSSSSSSTPSPTPPLPTTPTTPSHFSCKTPPTSTSSFSNNNNIPRLSSSLSHHHHPSSPHSPSFSFLLNNSLRLSSLSKSKRPTRCAICSHSVKSGQGTAIFTAECSHSFHFPCISNSSLHSCPVCSQHWNHSPFLPPPIHHTTSTTNNIKLYDDDEPLMSPLSGIRFNPIPESDEEQVDDLQFPGFYSDPVTPRPQLFNQRKAVDVVISPEAAMVSVGRSYETYAVLLTIRAPPSPPGSRRPSVDLVCILDVGGDMNVHKLQALKRAMRGVISCLSSNDRLSIVAFSSTSKRLLPLRRMNPHGRRSARRIVEALHMGRGSCVNDALRKAAKVIQDRKDKNHSSTIILFDAQQDDPSSNKSRFQLLSSTHYSRLEIPVHTFRIGEELHEEDFVKSISGFLSVVVLDLRIQLGLASGSAPAEIAGVYSCTGRPTLLNAGFAKLGDLYSEEGREILVELKVAASSIGSNHLISVRSFHKEACTKQLIYGGDESVLVPRPHTIRSSDPGIQCLRSLFVMTRAVAEGRRLIKDGNDLGGAERLLVSARAVLGQSRLKFTRLEEFRRRVEAELAEVRWRRQEEKRKIDKERGSGGRGGCCVVEERASALTPTSAWKVAECLAKVAMMRKSMNRVSDLYGFEDARF